MPDFKIGDKVNYTTGTGGLQIECVILSINRPGLSGRNIQVEDVATGLHVWVYSSDLDYDKAYYRNKALESLGI